MARDHVFITDGLSQAARERADLSDAEAACARNVEPHAFAIDKAARAHIKAQRPCAVWFTGLPAAGKSTIVNLVDQRLTASGAHTGVLDGDSLRHGLNRDLGFTDADRIENIRRAGHVARLMAEAGLIVLCAFVSPFRFERRVTRGLMDVGEFIEVFVDTPIHVCMQRDPKGLYAKARDGRVSQVTGIDSPYEAPHDPDIHLVTTTASADVLADVVVCELTKRGIVRNDAFR